MKKVIRPEGEWAYENKRYILSYDKNYPKGNEDIVLSPEELIDKVITHDRKILLSIKEGSLKKDYLGLLSSVKNNLKKGEIIGTKEALLKKFKKKEYHLKNLREARYNVLDKVYMSIIEISQALLLIKGFQIVSPRNLIEELNKKAKGKVSIRKAEKIIKTFKNYEHGKISLPRGKELDLIIKYADEYYEEVKRLL